MYRLKCSTAISGWMDGLDGIGLELRTATVFSGERENHLCYSWVTLEGCHVEQTAMLAVVDGVEVEVGTQNLLISKILPDKLSPLFSSHGVHVKDVCRSRGQLSPAATSP